MPRHAGFRQREYRLESEMRSWNRNSSYMESDQGCPRVSSERTQLAALQLVLTL